MNEIDNSRKIGSIGGLKKGIIIVFWANFINLAMGLIKGFILPKYISVESYAYLQSYLLYVSLVGFLHFGYLDGIYLKYGGKKFEDIGEIELNITRINTIIIQIIITIIAIIISILSKNIIFMLFSISILPLNMITLYKNIFQATGLFKNYSKILNINTILSFIGQMALLVFKVDNYIPYVIVLIVVDFLVWFLLEIKLNKTCGIKYKFINSKAHLIENIKDGFPLMIGNFSSLFLTSIDRFCVKIFLNVTDFAYYSFIVRVENLLMVFINPIVTTMYNYFCKMRDIEEIKRIKRLCLIAGVFLVGSAFPVKFILEHFLQKYEQSKNVLFILFSTEAVYLIIKGIYINLFKARKQQKTYFRQLIIILIFGIISDLIFVKIFNTNEAIALATLLSSILWIILCSTKIPEIRFNVKEIFFLITSLTIFILLGIYVNSILGFVIYYIYIIMFAVIFMREQVKYLIWTWKNIFKKITNKGLTK